VLVVVVVLLVVLLAAFSMHEEAPMLEEYPLGHGVQ
jgi:hypothetical protein